MICGHCIYMYFYSNNILIDCKFKMQGTVDIDIGCIEFMVHGRVAWSMTCSPPFYIGRARAQTTSRLLGRAGATSHSFAITLSLSVVSSTCAFVHDAHTAFDTDPEYIGSPYFIKMIDVVQRPRDGCLYEIRQKGQKDPCYVVVPNPKDLVKSHLMFAVREEVEVLKERIAELMERINQLEVENTYLRAHASQDTLAALPAAAGSRPPAQPQGPQPPVS